MKFNITILSILFSIFSFGQITFNTIPLDKQLVARDLITNIGQLIIEGEVDNSSINYDSIEVELYRDNVLQTTSSQILNYTSNIALFDFSIPILAELTNYSLKIFSKSGSTLTLENEIIDLVAGDVYIIQGQSNAEARLFDGSSSAFQDNFIRVHSFGISNPIVLLNWNEWFVGQGDGFASTFGNTGQWGLKIAKSIIESTNIPVAIFNGAVSGREINFFQAPSDYQTSQTSNYSRLYYRLNITALKNYVRGVFWAQGERDADINEATSTTEYKNAFSTLKNSWAIDYPNIEKIYIFQTKNGCDKPINNLMQIKEAQRQLAYENSDISIMSTAAITHHTDLCHFPFANGYEIFADRISPMVLRDFYDISPVNEIDPPMITNAYMSDDTTLIVETDATNLSITTTAEDFELSNAGSATITDITVSQNNIIFTLSESPDINLEISYLAQYFGPGNFITNTNNLELICFNKYPVNTSVLSTNYDVLKDNLIVHPNPTSGLISIKLPNNENQGKIKLINFLGVSILEKKIKASEFNINLPDVKGIYLLIIEAQNKVHVKKIIKL